MALPPCGVDHHPKDQFFAKEDPALEMVGVFGLTFIAGVVLGAIGLFAYASRLPILWVVVAAGTVFYLLQLVGQLRESFVGGVFADDLHAGMITTDSFARLRRKIADRSQISEIQITEGRLTVVLLDGSKLFATSFMSSADMDRFAAFVGGRVTREVPAPIGGPAVPAGQTQARALTQPAQRAAGLLLGIGPLLLFIALINMLIRLPFLTGGALLMGAEILAGLAVYGALYTVLGLRLSRGSRGSRELALYGGGGATAAMLIGVFAATGSLPVTAFFAILFVPIYAVVAYLLRAPIESS